MRYSKNSRFLLLAGCAVLAGCGAETPKEPAEALPGRDEVRERLDGVLNFTYRERGLNTNQHAAWQILHGVLAFKQDFDVDHHGQTVSAVEHLLSGGKMKGWTTQRGYLLDEEQGVYGLRAIVEGGTGTGQGHWDQWLAVLAQCDLPPTQEIVVDDQMYTIESYVRQVQRDLPRNVEQEYSWTLIGLTTYLPTSAQWEAFDGSLWSIEDLVAAEAQYAIGDGACGGTHRLIGLAMALNRHIAQGGKVTGVWQLADDQIQEAIGRAKQYQNPNGSFSTNYLTSGGNSVDLAQNMRTTGHLIEFLTLAMTNEQLEEEWVTRAVVYLCEVFEKTKRIDLECGALYHAAHGLVLYRNRVFSPVWSPRKM